MDSASVIVLALALIIIMLGMGLSLTINDFKRIFTNPKAILVGLTNQLILLPLVGFLLISVFPINPEIAVGVIILAACPGGPTSNLITHIAKGDTALSVSLTAISSLITIITIPFVVNLGLQVVNGQHTEIQLNVVETIIQIFAIVIVPVAIGMFIRAKKENFANRMEKPVRTASGLVLALVIIGILVKEKENIIPYFQQAGLITLALNIITMGIGYISAILFKLSLKQGRSIAIESGIQNGTMAITIATVLLANSSYAIAPAIYSLIMFFTGGIIIFIALRRKDKA